MSNLTTSGATPLVRSLATQLGVTLAVLTGTGIGGRITPADVRAAGPRQRGAALAGAGRRRTTGPRASGVERGADEYRRRAGRDPIQPGEPEPDDNVGRTAGSSTAAARLAHGQALYANGHHAVFGLDPAVLAPRSDAA
jgi:pyruvate/2-oxoglutarate dehydrogenase complex dihydrolipoamide acyltransferase (E2) component